MNQHEKIISSFSKEFFYASFVFDNLKIKPANSKGNYSSNVEFADLLILVGETLVVCELKAKNSNGKKKFLDWFFKKVYCNAHQQHVRKINYIRSFENIKFRNSVGKTIDISPSSIENLLFVSIFDAKTDDYPRFHTTNCYFCKSCEQSQKKDCCSIGNYNIFSTDDFRQACKEIQSPVSFLNYLVFRCALLEKSEGSFVVIIEHGDKTFCSPRPNSEASILGLYLSSEYPIIDYISQACANFHKFINTCIEPVSFCRDYFNMFSSFSRQDVFDFMNCARECAEKQSNISLFQFKNQCVCILPLSQEDEIRKLDYDLLCKTVFEKDEAIESILFLAAFSLEKGFSLSVLLLVDKKDFLNYLNSGGV